MEQSKPHRDAKSSPPFEHPHGCGRAKLGARPRSMRRLAGPCGPGLPRAWLVASVLAHGAVLKEVRLKNDTGAWGGTPQAPS